MSCHVPRSDSADRADPCASIAVNPLKFKPRPPNTNRALLEHAELSNSSAVVPHRPENPRLSPKVPLHLGQSRMSFWPRAYLALLPSAILADLCRNARAIQRSRSAGRENNAKCSRSVAHLALHAILFSRRVNVCGRPPSGRPAARYAESKLPLPSAASLGNT
jgi:hypothetical protein